MNSLTVTNIVLLFLRVTFIFSRFVNVKTQRGVRQYVTEPLSVSPSRVPALNVIWCDVQTLNVLSKTDRHPACKIKTGEKI